MKVLFIMFCKNRITVLRNWEVACEIIRNKIGESPLDKLYIHMRFFFFIFPGNKSVYIIRGYIITVSYCIICMQLNLALLFFM